MRSFCASDVYKRQAQDHLEAPQGLLQRHILAGHTGELLCHMEALAQEALHLSLIHIYAIGPSVPLLIAKIFGKHTVCTVHGLNWKVDKWRGFASRYMKLEIGRAHV